MKPFTQNGSSWIEVLSPKKKLNPNAMHFPQLCRLGKGKRSLLIWNYRDSSIKR